MKRDQNPSKPKLINLSPLFRILIGIVLSGISAVLLVLSMPPYGIFIFAVLAFIPLVFAQYRIFPKKISSLAMAITIAGLIALYIMDAFLELPSAPWFMRWLPLIFGVFILFADSSTRAFHESTDYRWMVLSSAFGWVGVEMIRSLLPIMGTWGFLGYAYFKQPWLIQPVSVFGIFGLSLVTTLLGYALGQLSLAWFDRRWQIDENIPSVELRKARKWVICTGLVYIGWCILSLILFAIPIKDTVRVAALQPDYQAFFTEPEKETLILSNTRYQLVSRESYQTLLAQTEHAAAQGAQVIVWPEGGISFDPHYSHTAELKELAAQSNAYLVIAYAVDYRNEVTVLSPEGKFLGTYGKNHPVSFVGERSDTHGTYPSYVTDVGDIGTIICYDLDFTDTARNVARNGADLIAVPSGDWPGIADKHYAHAVFRAAENRTAMIKDDRSYDSAIIGPYGQIVDKVISIEGQRSILVADVPIFSSKPIQQYLGDWIGWVSLSGMVLFAVVNIVKSASRGKRRNAEK